MDTQKQNLLGLALALAGTFLFSLKPILIKYAYSMGVSSEQVISYRMLIAFPIYGWVMLAAFRRHPNRKAKTRQLLPFIGGLGILGYFISSYLDLLGLQYISAQLERVVLFCFPTFVVIMSKVFFNTQLPKNIWLLLGLSYGGILLIFGHDFSVIGDQVLLGTALVLTSAITFSFYVLWSKKLMADIGSQLFTSIAMMAASIGILFYFNSVYPFSFWRIPIDAFWIIAALAVFCTVIPSLLVAEAIHQIGPEQTSIVGTCGPVLTSIVAVFLLDEAFTVYHGAGLMLVVTAVALMTKQKAA